jgi:hypothetical protein
MSIKLKFSPELPEGMAFQGELVLDGVAMNFISMTTTEATIDTPDPKQLAHALKMLTELLQVSITTDIDGEAKTIEPPGDEEIANSVVSEVNYGAWSEDPITVGDNVFELDFESMLETPVIPGAPLAEVVPIRAKAVESISLWETLFAKPSPVRDLASWTASEDSNDYIYVPNDLSKMEGEKESFSKNAAFTQIMLEAYKQACKWKGVNPNITLEDGSETLPVLKLVPLDASQPHVPNEIAARLANSTVDIEDGFLVESFLTCIRAMTPDDYDSPVAHLTVLAKTEIALTGTSQLVTNYTVIKKLCDFTESEFARSGSFMEGNSAILNAVLFTLRQMVLEDRVLSSSKDHFMACMSRAGLAEFSSFLLKAYEKACS